METVENELADQCRPIGEAPVQGGDVHPGTAGDLIQRSGGTGFQERLARRGQHVGAVSLGVRTQTPTCAR
ncbi:hypothetical protein [Streptomyces sp. YGL11-2]|uniref:hypothetical protein n=1 Tax=Streptomyces sp. YGL11-2 TaxID=3414028 RepID=UPI003CE89985